MRKLFICFLIFVIVLALVSCANRSKQNEELPHTDEKKQETLSDFEIETVLEPFHLDFTKCSLNSFESMSDDIKTIENYPVYLNRYPVDDGGAKYEFTEELQKEIISNLKVYLSFLSPNESFDEGDFEIAKRSGFSVSISHNGTEFNSTANEITFEATLTENTPLESPLVSAALKYLDITNPDITVSTEYKLDSSVSNIIYKIVDKASSFEEQILNNNFSFVKITTRPEKALCVVQIVKVTFEESDKTLPLPYDKILKALYEEYPQYEGKEILSELYYNDTAEPFYYIPLIRFYIENQTRESTIYERIDVMPKRELEFGVTFGKIINPNGENLELITDDGTSFILKPLYDLKDFPTLNEKHRVYGRIDRESSTIFIDLPEWIYNIE